MFYHFILPIILYSVFFFILNKKMNSWYILFYNLILNLQNMISDPFYINFGMFSWFYGRSGGFSKGQFLPTVGGQKLTRWWESTKPHTKFSDPPHFWDAAATFGSRMSTFRCMHHGGTESTRFRWICENPTHKYFPQTYI